MVLFREERSLGIVYLERLFQQNIMHMEYLYKKLFICEREDVGDGGGLIVQTETREQQKESRRSGSSSVTCALTVLTRRLANELNKAHHQALTHTLTAKLALRET